jgi:dihydrofolate reductase
MRILGETDYQMRNLVYAINMSLDGTCDHTKVIGSPEMLAYYAQFVRGYDTFLYGRVTYELMVPYWPDIIKNPAGSTKEAIDYAEAFVSMKEIVVFSKTLEKAEGENTRILRGYDLQAEILQLKQQPGRDILMGGVDLASQVIALGLVDEYIILVQPIIAGEGRRLMQGVPLQKRMPLKLVETKTFDSGSVVLRYLKE